MVLANQTLTINNCKVVLLKNRTNFATLVLLDLNAPADAKIFSFKKVTGVLQILQLKETFRAIFLTSAMPQSLESLCA